LVVPVISDCEIGGSSIAATSSIPAALQNFYYSLAFLFGELCFVAKESIAQ